MYTYGGFTLLYGRNQRSFVKQLSTNYNELKKYQMQIPEHWDVLWVPASGTLIFSSW